ncbi:uncharacterized protein FYW23_007661 [Sylvia borin]
MGHKQLYARHILGQQVSSVRVKDLGNQSPGNCALATLEIAIMENTQVPFSFQSTPGSEIITVKAENINDSKTNRLIAYGILSQKPRVSNGFSFNTGRDI